MYSKSGEHRRGEHRLRTSSDSTSTLAITAALKRGLFLGALSLRVLVFDDILDRLHQLIQFKRLR